MAVCGGDWCVCVRGRRNRNGGLVPHRCTSPPQEDVLHKHVKWSLGATADKLRTWYGRGGAMQDASFALALQKRIMEQRAKEAYVALG